MGIVVYKLYNIILVIVFLFFYYVILFDMCYYGVLYSLYYNKIHWLDYNWFDNMM